MDNTFSNNIKKLRIDLNLTQKEFAQKIEITPSTMSSYEKGDKKPTLDTLIKIATEFNISLNELCGIQKENISREIKYDTYTDIFKILAPLIELDKELLSIILIDSEVIISTFDEIIYDFIDEYITMRLLRNKGSITQKIFDEWYSSKLSKYEDDNLYDY